MITIHYMWELKIEPEHATKLEIAAQLECTEKLNNNAADGQLVRCRIGRFFWDYGLLRKQELTFANQTQEMCPILYELPSQYEPKKKRQLVEAVRRQTGELWLEEKLAQELGETFSWQPDALQELICFRIYEEAAAWSRHCRQNGGEFESLVVWDAGADTSIFEERGESKANAADSDMLNRNEKEAFVELLFSLAESVNYFTIIGTDAQGYLELAERLFAENGLPVRFLEKPVRGYHYGPTPFVLAMAGKRKIRQDIFGMDAKYLDPYAGMPKFLDTIARNGYNT